MNNTKYSDNYSDLGELNIAAQTVTIQESAKSQSIGSWGTGGYAAGSARFDNGAWNFATGAGVTIGVVDAGLNPGHADFVGQYLDDLTYNGGAGGSGSSASPLSAGTQHGTQVAGVIVGLKNEIAADGGAFGAKMSASHITYGSGVDLSELADLLDYQSAFDISNNSWGFTSAFADNFNSSAFAGMAEALETVAADGRDGLGTAFVVAGGNSKMMIGGQNYGDDSNFHNFSNSRFAIAVGAHDSKGNAAFFSSPGANILISAPGVGIVTATGEGDSEAYVSGTSFAAPLVSAAIALMLEVNPDLGYRDIQEILAITAKSSSALGAMENGAGNVNGGGMIFDRELGFGGLDAEAAVKLARVWNTQSTLDNEAHLNSAFEVPEFADGSVQVLELDLAATGTGKFSIDFVELTLEVNDSDLRDLSIVLISPDGTETLIAPNLYAAGSKTALNFTFSSVATWGEDPFGTWQLRLSHSSASDDFTINGASLDVYGDFATADDSYYFTSSFKRLAQSDDARTFIADADGGSDTLNFAASRGKLKLDMDEAGVSKLAKVKFTVSEGFENAVGSVGKDLIRGNALDNLIDGDLGRDKLFGRDGDDTLFGGDGHDRLEGGAGGDSLFGGAGFDVARYATAGTGVTLDFGTGLHAGEAEGDLFDSIEQFVLSRFDDLFTGALEDVADQVKGGNGRDTLNGETGDDRLWGQNGNDMLIGGAGDDLLNGGRGRDQLLGGEGSDIFAFAKRGARDVIKDFECDVDRIDLRSFNFKNKAQALSEFKEMGSKHNDLAMFKHQGTKIVIKGADVKDIDFGDLLI